MKSGKKLRTKTCWATPDKIVIRGLDLCEDILGKVDFGQMAFFEIFGRLPNEKENRMFNAMLVVLVEHGMNPSTIATRMTYFGAPESVQAAMAAGLLGLGTVFVGSLDQAAKMLQEALPPGTKPGNLDELARNVVADMRSKKQKIPGIGHPFHKPIDPRTPRMFQIAKETGFHGPYVDLMQKIGAEAERVLKRSFPINATGALAALSSEFGLPWQICRGIAVSSRAVGLVSHILEEMKDPMAGELYARVEDEATEEDRPA